MGLFKTLCWALMFLTRLCFLHGSSIATILGQISFNLITVNMYCNLHAFPAIVHCSFLWKDAELEDQHSGKCFDIEIDMLRHLRHSVFSKSCDIFNRFKGADSPLLGPYPRSTNVLIMWQTSFTTSTLISKSHDAPQNSIIILGNNSSSSKNERKEIIGNAFEIYIGQPKITRHMIFNNMIE